MVKNRVFSFSNRECPSGPAGGSKGVNKRLYEANKKLKYFDQMIHIFSDTVLEKYFKITINAEAEKYYELVGNSNEIAEYYIKLHEHYRFTDDDVYIFHDLESANNFYSLFKHTKTLLVYHQQGTPYREWQFFSGGKENNELKEKSDSFMERAFKSMKYVGFPSKGSIESIIDSDISLAELINSVEKKILYNGCDCEKNIEPETPMVKEVVKVIDLFNSEEKPIFITVATLNEAKGVERIPEYLSQIKNKYGDLLWIVVGNGVKKEELLQNVDKYNLESNVLLIQDKIPNRDVLAMYEKTDFYILAHRFSIFDFATIEAMHYGNIPILTPVGGNKEVIIDDNGIFINDLSDISDFDNFINFIDVNVAKEKNMAISDRLFSEKAFLQGYLEVVEELLQ